METTNDRTRGFIHFSAAWYARHNNHRDGMIDCVNFGDWHADGSGTGAAMVWYTTGGPRLECFHDGWFTLAGMRDLIGELGNLGGEAITPLDFCSLLSALNFTDRTPLDRFGTIPTTQAQRQAATVAIMVGEVEALMARELSDAAQAEPLISVGDAVYFYARPGAVLAQGWYICTVTGRPSRTSALVVFQLADGATHEREEATRNLFPEPPITAPVLNAAEHRAAMVRYFHTADYGWLKVGATLTQTGLALISASSRGEVLIADELVYAADLHAALPADTIAWNEPILGQRQNGDPERLICPNCEGGQYDNQTDAGNPLSLHACIHCHFNFIKPTRVDAPQLPISAADESMAEHRDNIKRAQERLAGFRHGLGLDLAE